MACTKREGDVKESGTAAQVPPPIEAAAGTPTATAPRVPNGRRPQFRDDIAHARVGDPKWQPCIWRCIGERDKGGAVIISGGEPRILASGPRKGRPTWKHIPRDRLIEVVVTEAEVRLAEVAYETETGNCFECGGGGAELASADARGLTYRACRRCKGTGNAPPPLSSLSK